MATLEHSTETHLDRVQKAFERLDQLHADVEKIIAAEGALNRATGNRAKVVVSTITDHLEAASAQMNLAVGQLQVARDLTRRLHDAARP